VASVAERFGGVDGLVVNADAGVPGTSLSAPAEDFAAQFDVLVVTALRTVRAAVPHLRDSAMLTRLTIRFESNSQNGL
jgi:NAD(P)-dependent dehydrogenase (short-subunit alcohol dehydrogenase family)